jgi:hypothetical protein
MVKSAKYLLFLFVWYALSIFVTPSIGILFLQGLPIILSLFFRDLFISLLESDNRVVILSLFLVYGFISGLLQAVALRVVINSKSFLIRWVIASALGTYLGRLTAELYGNWQSSSIEQLYSGNSVWGEFEKYFQYPILSFFQGVVIFTCTKFYSLFGLIWWLTISTLSVIQTNSFDRYFLSLSEKSKNADSLLNPSEGQIFISGLIMIGIIHFSKKINANIK